MLLVFVSSKVAVAFPSAGWRTNRSSHCLLAIIKGKAVEAHRCGWRTSLAAAFCLKGLNVRSKAASHVSHLIFNCDEIPPSFKALITETRSPAEEATGSSYSRGRSLPLLRLFLLLLFHILLFFLLHLHLFSFSSISSSFNSSSSTFHELFVLYFLPHFLLFFLYLLHRITSTPPPSFFLFLLFFIPLSRQALFFFLLCAAILWDVEQQKLPDPRSLARSFVTWHMENSEGIQLSGDSLTHFTGCGGDQQGEEEEPSPGNGWNCPWLKVAELKGVSLSYIIISQALQGSGGGPARVYYLTG